MGGFHWSQIGAGGVAVLAGAALLWLIYFDTKDVFQKEPRHLILAAFGLGLGAGGLALAGFVAGEALGLPAGPGRATRDVLTYCLLVIGPIEEGAKFLVARAIVFRWKAFDEEIDGLVYAASLAIGFATFESLLYLPHLGSVERLARAATAPLTHALFACVWGFGLSHALLAPRALHARLGWQAGTLLLAMALHGLYDALLIGWEATVPASATILVIWLGLLRWAHRALHRPRALERPIGAAPAAAGSMESG